MDKELNNKLSFSLPNLKKGVYLLKTNDFGKTWTAINKGIDPDHFTRVIRLDPDREGLLYAGTESGLYVSFDDGANWESFQMN